MKKIEKIIAPGEENPDTEGQGWEETDFAFYIFS